MEQKFNQLTSTKEAVAYVNSLNDNQIDAEVYYQIIPKIQNKNQFQILKASVQKGLGYTQFSQNQKLFEQMIDKTKEADMIALYHQFSRNYFNNNDFLFGHIGFQLDKIINEGRKNGSMQKITYLEKEQYEYEEKQTLIIRMLLDLVPKYFSLSPELLQSLLLLFARVDQPDHPQIPILQDLANMIIKSNQYEENRNNDHDWMLFLSQLFEQSFREEGFGMIILLKKIDLELLSQLIIGNEKYLLLNYLYRAETTLQIFHGLFKNYIIPQNLEIIRSISDIMLKQVIQYQSSLYFQILNEVYERFILTKILSNIQVVTCTQNVLELLQFYIIGLSQIKPNEFQNEIVDFMCKRLEMLLNFKKTDFSSQIFNFITKIGQAYPKHQQNQKLNQIKQQCTNKNRSLSGNNNVQIQNLVWKVNQSVLSQNDISFALLQKDENQYVGLENLKNTCYMNSFIYCLFLNQVFRGIILQLKLNEDPSIFFNDEQSLVSAFQKVFMLLSFQSQGYCSPYQLKATLREPYANQCDQQDVNEFGHHLLEDLEQLLPEYQAQYLARLFKGYQVSIIECGLCGKSKAGAKEKILGLDLHIANIEEEEPDLYPLLKEYFSKEHLEYTCGFCNKKSETCSKRNQLLILPPFLTITIQRFTFNLVKMTKEKILKKVITQFDLDFRKVFPQFNLPNEPSYYYQLYAFIVHMGSSSDSGHYMTYGRQIDKDPDQWIIIDDNYIRSMTIEDPKDLDEKLAAEENPYILFFKNKTLEPCDFSKFSPC